MTKWQVHNVYQKGNTVTYQGKMWQAQWWTQLEIPGLLENSPWEIIKTCTPL
ncbi:carbohydrate-binding protein [Aliivibrio sp. EL58]|uniref:carbohydrate-binding protein n=1 Tax=Aliivibrio sp. EL58 TaxID=2107582 RepID=UPI0020B14817|nr:carbohydrate-binding protein [Aliivibrio sp. EL58]